MEESQTTNLTVSFPPTDETQGTSYTIPINSDDDGLGYRLIQRSDSPSHVYDTGKIRWKMMMIY